MWWREVWSGQCQFSTRWPSGWSEVYSSSSRGGRVKLKYARALKMPSLSNSLTYFSARPRLAQNNVNIVESYLKLSNRHEITQFFRDIMCTYLHFWSVSYKKNDVVFFRKLEMFFCANLKIHWGFARCCPLFRRWCKRSDGIVPDRKNNGWVYIMSGGENNQFCWWNILILVGRIMNNLNCPKYWTFEFKLRGKNSNKMRGLPVS